MRLIDANALIQAHCGACANKKFCAEEACQHYEIRKRIEAAPTIDAQPVQHGRWVDWSMWGNRNYQCSECDCETKHKTNYCPHCGARMDGDPDA